MHEWDAQEMPHDIHSMPADVEGGGWGAGRGQGMTDQEAEDLSQKKRQIFPAFLLVHH